MFPRRPLCSVAVVQPQLPAFEYDDYLADQTEMALTISQPYELQECQALRLTAKQWEDQCPSSLACATHALDELKPGHRFETGQYTAESKYSVHWCNKMLVLQAHIDDKLVAWLIMNLRATRTIAGACDDLNAFELSISFDSVQVATAHRGQGLGKLLTAHALELIERWARLLFRTRNKPDQFNIHLSGQVCSNGGQSLMDQAHRQLKQLATDITHANPHIQSACELELF